MIKHTFPPIRIPQRIEEPDGIFRDEAGRWHACSKGFHGECPCDPKWRVLSCTCECHTTEEPKQ